MLERDLYGNRFTFVLAIDIHVFVGSCLVRILVEYVPSASFLQPFSLSFLLFFLLIPPPLFRQLTFKVLKQVTISLVF